MSTVTLIEFKGDGLKNWLTDKRKSLKNYSVNFIRHIQRITEDLAILTIVFARKQAGMKNFNYDTGTMYKRIDYNIVEWNRIVFGIFEPSSEFYDESKHKPTPEFYRKYKGWKPSPDDKHYASFRHDLNPFVKIAVDRFFNIEIKKAANEYHKKYFK